MECAAEKQTPARAEGAGVGFVLQGCRSEELRTSGAHLPLSLCPGSTEPGLWGSFSGRPHPQEGLSTPGSNISGWAQSPNGVGEGREACRIFYSPSLQDSLE